MPAFLEPVVWILRAGPEATEYGTPYTASGTVVTLGNGECLVLGLTRQSEDKSGAVGLVRDAERCLRDAGFKKWHWDRKRKGGFHHVIGALDKGGK
jgi:hypothetical protein